MEQVIWVMDFVDQIDQSNASNDRILIHADSQ